MPRRPRRSTLFPCPTLFRSGLLFTPPAGTRADGRLVGLLHPDGMTATASSRSEEHTSDLQSRFGSSNAAATTEIYPLPLPDPLPIWPAVHAAGRDPGRWPPSGPPPPRRHDRHGQL